MNIIGRNFEYPEALRLIQNEDYLDDADIDELRRSDAQKDISKFHHSLSKGNHGIHASSKTKVNGRRKRSEMEGTCITRL